MGLTESQTDLLAKIESISCGDVLADFNNLAELRKRKDYKVVVSDRMYFIKKIKNELQAIQDLINDLSLKSNNGTITEEEEAILKYETLKEIMEDWLHRSEHKTTLRNKIEYPHPLLGLYRNWDFSYNSPVIYLFKENIDDYAKRCGRSADNIFAYVYVHESMHTYYDSMNSDGGFISELEEAFAECGMLEFLVNAISHDNNLKELADDAYDDVMKKQTYGPYEYGFGLPLNELSHKNGKKTADMMSRYREISNWIQIDGDVRDYKDRISRLSKQSLDNARYDHEAKECFDLVKKILDKKYDRPNDIVDVNPYLEPHMRKNGVTVSKNSPLTGWPSGGTIPVGAEGTVIYSGTKEKHGESYRLVQIFASEEPTEMAYAIFKIANIVSGERAMAQMIYYYDYFCQGIYPDKVHVYSPLCSKVSGKVNYMPWSFSIDGNPIYIQKGWQLDPEPLTAESPSLCLLLDALNKVSGPDNRFSILCSGTVIVLYGTEKIKKAVEKEPKQ